MANVHVGLLNRCDTAKGSLLKRGGSHMCECLGPVPMSGGRVRGCGVVCGSPAVCGLGFWVCLGCVCQWVTGMRCLSAVSGFTGLTVGEHLLIISL